jgi:hypothetical protein
MQKIALPLLLIVFFVTANAQDNNYSVALIAPQLLKNANAVKRMEEKKIVISDISKATIYYKYAITILNESGDENALYEDYYDHFRDIKHVEGKLFDKDGNKIRSMKKSELQDVSAIGSDMMSDGRAECHDFQYKQYPYTIEYESEVELKSIFNLPDWQPVKNKNLSVEASSFKVQYPANYHLRYKALNYNKAPDSTQQDATTTYNWSAANIPAIVTKQYQPELYQLTPTVFLAASDFKMDNYTGNMDTWKGYGEFIYSLNQGRDELPENIKETVHALTDKLTDVHKKIKVLYEFLQKNTRYVSIQLGIGGWQTFDAKYVATKGYGDCKALSNYMHSLLKEAGIKGYCTCIKAGASEAKKNLDDFPFNCFNHIIICVPLKTDTVWLECTNSYLPAGYLSAFTSNRDALMIDEDGGKIVHTPFYNKEYNLQIRKINAVLDSTGLLQLDVHGEYTGLKQDNLSGVLTLPNEKLKEYQKGEINLPSYNIDTSDYSIIKNKFPIINEHLKITANNYAAVSGRRIFINPNILTRYENNFKEDSKRNCSIIIRSEYRDIDSIEIRIPDGYAAESVPTPVSIESKFGKYECSVKVLPGKIIYYRLHESNSGVFWAFEAKALTDFFDQISKADRAKVVLVKNN